MVVDVHFPPLAIQSFPPGASTQSGACTLQHDGFLFAAGPHLPQMGRDMQLIAHSSFSGHVTLLDTAYDPAGAHVGRLEQQVPMRAGETVEIRCERHNATGEIVTEDISRMHGMCYGNIYRYPAQSDGFLCGE